LVIFLGGHVGLIYTIAQQKAKALVLTGSLGYMKNAFEVHFRKRRLRIHKGK
jgi:hypothetical protein